jgi:hypothetical protein
MHPFARLVYCCGALLLVLACAGCVSKSKANAEAKRAFAAGEQRAMMRMQQAQTPHVTVNGSVRNPLLPWTEDMTVAKAIVAAGYYGAKAPKEILIVRQGQALRLDPAKLLNGEDIPLQSGDVLELR